MLRVVPAVLLCLSTLLFLAPSPAPGAPPGPSALALSIETSRTLITDYEKTLRAYDAETRITVANDPASTKRREEIRILKQHYVREIENLKAKIQDDYKKIQEFKSRGIMQ